MPRRAHVAAALFVLLAAAFSRMPAGAQSGAAAQERAHHVIVISLDGFAGWALEDPYLPVPTLRALAASGAAAKSMRPVDPTVTWANHTSMVTGVPPAQHRVIYNGLLVREPGVPPRVEPWRDRKELVHARTVYDAAHEKGLTTAQVDWVAIQNAPSITWEFPERPDPKGAVAQEMVKAGLITQSDLETFHTKNIVWRDHIWTAAAAHIIRQHRPNLLLFHLLNLDSTQHRYGPRTPAAMTAMAYLDMQVATVMRAVQEAGIADRTTVFVVSDHGFKTVKRHIRPNVALARAGLLTVEQGKPTRAQAYFMSEGGTGLVYVTVPDPDGALLARARAAVRALEGVESIIEAHEFGSLGLPAPTPTSQTGALLLKGQDGYAFSADVTEPATVDAPAGSLGSHGYLASDPDLRALFIASGRGVRAGVALDTVSTLDLAPTIARLLQLSLPEAQGRVLSDILTNPAPLP